MSIIVFFYNNTFRISQVMFKMSKCNCGKKATEYYHIHHKDYVSCINLCKSCAPKELNTWNNFSLKCPSYQVRKVFELKSLLKSYKVLINSFREDGSQSLLTNRYFRQHQLFRPALDDHYLCSSPHGISVTD